MSRSMQESMLEGAPRPRSRRGVRLFAVLPVLVFLSVLAAACGGTPSASNTTTTAGVTETSSSSVNTTASTAATTTTVAATPLGGGNFCNFAGNVAKQNQIAAAAGATSATSLKTDFQKLQSEEPAILAAAPAAIKGDFQTLFAYFNKFYGTLASVNYDFTKLTPAMEQSFEAGASQISAASKAINTYVTKTCGITPTS